MSVLDDYLARTPRSRELFERATGSLPGGSTRTTVYTAPYPPYVASGSGLRLRDVDGNSYRDFLCNYTSLILGHAHPESSGRVGRRGRLRRGRRRAARAAGRENEAGEEKEPGEKTERMRSDPRPRTRAIGTHGRHLLHGYETDEARRRARFPR